MQYEVIKGRINGKVAGELVDLDEKVAESYGETYIKPLELSKKQAKAVKNKALSHNDVETKDEQRGVDQ